MPQNHSPREEERGSVTLGLRAAQTWVPRQVSGLAKPGASWDPGMEDEKLRTTEQ